MPDAGCRMPDAREGPGLAGIVGATAACSIHGAGAGAGQKTGS